MFPLNYLFPDSYYEVVQDTPVVLTPTTTAQAIMPAHPYKWVFAYMVRVRSMGTATYIGIGNAESQAFRLTIVGETFGYNSNPQEIFDLTNVWYVSDTNDSTLELIATYMPIPMQGGVILAKTRGLE